MKCRMHTIFWKKGRKEREIQIKNKHACVQNISGRIYKKMVNVVILSKGFWVAGEQGLKTQS